MVVVVLLLPQVRLLSRYHDLYLEPALRRLYPQVRVCVGVGAELLPEAIGSYPVAEKAPVGPRQGRTVRPAGSPGCPSARVSLLVLLAHT